MFIVLLLNAMAVIEAPKDQLRFQDFKKGNASVMSTRDQTDCCTPHTYCPSFGKRQFVSPLLRNFQQAGGRCGASMSQLNRTKPSPFSHHFYLTHLNHSMRRIYHAPGNFASVCRVWQRRPVRGLLVLVDGFYRDFLSAIDSAASVTGLVSLTTFMWHLLLRKC